MISVKTTKQNNVPATWKVILRRLEEKLEGYGIRWERKTDIREVIVNALTKIFLWILALVGVLSVILLALWFFGKAPFIEVYSLLKLLIVVALVPLLGLTIRSILQVRREK